MEDFIEKVAQRLDDIAAKVRSGEIRPLDYKMHAESVEGEDGQFIVRAPTGVLNLYLRFQRRA